MIWRERNEGHGLVAIGQSRYSLLGAHPPEGFAGEHMMVGVTWQIVVHGVRDGSVMRSDRRILDAHQTIVLHIVDQLME